MTSKYRLNLKEIYEIVLRSSSGRQSRQQLILVVMDYLLNHVFLGNHLLDVFTNGFYNNNFLVFFNIVTVYISRSLTIVFV